MIFRIGVLLMIVSFVPWFALPAAAWYAPTPAEKTTWTAGLFILGEVLFWSGVLLAGKEFWHSVKALGWKKALPEMFRKLRT